MRRPMAKLVTADRLLYRRGNFGGTVDQLICDALRREFDTEIALSPGFRWGCSVLPGQSVTMEDVLSETAITYPETYVQGMTGSQIKDMLEDVCDNLFNADPYYQQGGDMVRVGGFAYTCTPSESVGHRISELKLGGGSARSRQELQGGGMGFGQRTAGKAGVGCLRQTYRLRQCGALARQRRHLTGRRRQPGQRRSGMRHLGLAARSADDRAFGPPSSRPMAASPARAQPPPLQDKPFAEHRIVLQLSDDDAKKQRLVISVAYNLLKFYDPDKVAIEVVTFGPGIDLLRLAMPTANWSKAWPRRACASMSASIPSIRSSAKPAIGRTSLRSRPRFRSGSGKSCR